MKYFIAIALIFLRIYSVFAWNTPTISSPAQGSDQFTGVTLDWNAVAGSVAYECQIDTTPVFNSALLRSVTNAYINSSSSNTDTKFYVDDILFGTTHYWRVRAYIDGDTSAWTESFFNTKDYIVLSSPTIGSNQFTGVTIDWLAHTGVDFYEYMVDTSAAFDSPIVIQGQNAYINSVSSNTDTEHYMNDLFFGKEYFWKVRAINAADTSGWSETWSFNTKDYIVLSSPTIGSNQFTGVTIDWLAHTGVDFYEYMVDTSSAFDSPIVIQGQNAYINSVSSNTDTEHYLNDLFFGKEYFWKVRAINAVDTTEWSEVWNFNTTDNISLVAPIMGASAFTGVTIDWYAHAGVDFYEFVADTSQNFDSPVKIQGQNAYINSSSSNTDTQYYLSGLYFGKQYFWKVRAINAVDTSGWSETRNFNTLDYVQLYTPANEALNQSAAGITLDWYAHGGIDFYEFEMDSSNTFTTASYIHSLLVYINSSSSNNDTKYNTGSLSPNTVYFWRVRAINAVDTSSWNERWFSTGDVPLVLPDAPTLLLPNDQDTVYQSVVELSWDTVFGASSYEYQFGTNQLFETGINSTVANLVSTGTLQFGWYFWRARTISGAMHSDWSETRSFLVLDSLTNVGTKENAKITVFPNPAGEFLYFEKNISNLRIFDLNARLVYEQNDNVSTNKVFIGQLERGLYFGESIISGKRYTFRFVKM